MLMRYLNIVLQYVGETFPRDEISTNFLAHISEREAADGYFIIMC